MRRSYIWQLNSKYKKMKNIINRKNNIMKKLAWLVIFIPALLLNMISCTEDIGDNYYTFTGETVGAYITARPDDFSEFQAILDTTKVIGLLKAYGKYTCFLPTNSALKQFYKDRGKNSLKDFSMDSLRIIAYNHIIQDYEILTEEFQNGLLPYLSMNKRHIEVAIGASEKGVEYIINKTAKVLEKDVELHNGIVHILDGVVSPSDNSIVESIKEAEEFSLFYDALMATGLYELLLPIKDLSYEYSPDFGEEVDEGGIWNSAIVRVPHERLYGFTALMPSNQTFKNHGIQSIADMESYAKQIYDEKYPKDSDIDDITNRKNSLNRFIAYHLLDRRIPKEFFIEAYDNTGSKSGSSHSVKDYDMFEYIETLAPMTLLEVRTLRQTNEYNVFNMLDGETGVRLVEGNSDNDALNGVFHEIDGLLTYSKDVERMLTSKRMRMDGASFFPELINNNIRIGKKYREINNKAPEYTSELWMLPKGYLEGLTIYGVTTFGIFNADDRFLDYQGDEIFIRGLYDFEMVTPPIPAGTYEVRFGYQPTINRGAAQLYWDGIPCGIPLDLRLDADNAKIGYEAIGINPADMLGYENDKMMRNRGYMKAPASFKVVQDVPAWGYNQGHDGVARYSNRALRKILGIFTFEEDAKHVFSVRAARSGEFMFDYLEFVPVEVLEFEDIY